MSIDFLLAESWKTIWKSKWIWFCSLLISLSSLSFSIPATISCCVIPVELLKILAMLVGDIGLVYTGYHIAKGEAVNFEDMWYAITTFIGRVAAILFFTSLFFVLCFCCTIIFVYNKTSSGQVFTHPLWTLLLVILMFLGPLLSFAYMGVILYNLNIKASIEKGIHLFLDNIGILLGLFLLVLTISVIVNLVATLITLLIQSNFDIDRLGDISFGTYGTLAPTLLFGIIRTIGTFLVTPFTTMLYVLVYMHSRYGRPVSQSDGSNME